MNPPCAPRTSTGCDLGIPPGGPGNVARAIRLYLRVCDEQRAAFCPASTPVNGQASVRVHERSAE